MQITSNNGDQLRKLMSIIREIINIKKINFHVIDESINLIFSLLNIT